jgi:hypothetical protein
MFTPATHLRYVDVNAIVFIALVTLTANTSPHDAGDTITIRRD